VKTAVCNGEMSGLQVNFSVDGPSLDFYFCLSEIKKAVSSR
jgi:hypothetical protein